MASSGNFCTLNPLTEYDARMNRGNYSNGNLTYDDVGGDGWITNMAMTHKTYCEYRIDSLGGYGGVQGLRGMQAHSQVYDSVTFQASYSSGQIYHYKGSSDQSYSGNIGGTVSAGNIIMFAYDPATYRWWVGVNGTWRNSGDPANGTGYVFEGSATMFENMDVTWGGWSGDINRLDHTWNFGQDSTFGGQETAGGNADENGFGDFKYTPPTGFLALCSGNEVISDDIDPAQTDDAFPQKLFGSYTYTGNSGSAVTVSTDFQPDLIWIKSRDSADNHYLQDSSRGFGNSKSLSSNSTGPEGYNGGAPSSSGAQNVGSSSFQAYGSDWSKSTDNYVAWCWRANGGTTSSNSDGSITSTVQTNPAGNFSIITYTGTGSNATIGHGMTKKPAFIVVKNRNDTDSWAIYHETRTADFYTSFQYSIFSNNATFWNDTEPTTSVISIGTNNRVNGSGDSLVCYAWAQEEGFQKFGQYIGNGNADGPFIYTGFRPRMIYIKKNANSSYWHIFDTARNIDNPVDTYLLWDSTGADDTASSNSVDFLSNGFKLRNNASQLNASGSTYVFGAWGDVPFKYNNTF